VPREPTPGSRRFHLVSLRPQEQVDGLENMLLIIGGPKYGDGPCYSPARGGEDRLGKSCMFRLWTRSAYGTVHRVLDLDAIMFQSRPVARSVDFAFSCMVIALTRSNSARKIALGREGLIARSRPQFLFLLRNVECALGQVSCLARGVHPRASLFKRILCIANLNADLLLQLLPAQLGLRYSSSERN